MEIQGKIIVALPEITGTSSRTGNPWKKREYVLETQETYPKKVHFDFFGEKADQYPLQVGQEIKLSFDIESREYNGRWFTSIRGWKSEPITAAAAPAQPYGAPAQPYGAAPAGYPPAPGFGAPAAPAYSAPAAAGAVPPPPAMPAQEPADDLPF